MTTFVTIFRIAFFSLSGLFILVSYSAYQMNASQHMEDIAEANLQELRALGEQLADGSDYLTNEIKHYVQFGNKIHYENFWREVHETRSRDLVVKRLKELNVSPEELAYIEKAKEYSDRLIKTEEAAMQAVADKNFDKARELIFGDDYRQQKNLIMGNIKNFQDVIDQKAKAKLFKARARAKTFLTLTNILLILSAISVLFLVYFICMERLVKPLQKLTRIMLKISEGDTEARIPIVPQKNEIGEMALALNIFKTNLIKKNELEKELINKELEIKIQERTRDYKKSKEIAEQSNRAKSEFLSRVSHELRTPLNAILGFAQIVDFDLKRIDSTENSSHIEQILKNGRHLLYLINELLDQSRIESGQIKLNLQNVPLQNTLEEIHQMILPLVEERDVRLEIEPIDPEIHVFVDTVRFQQVLMNLLSNAIKYNKCSGFVRVTCTKTLRNTLRICVKDTGAGIPAEKMDQLFQPFNRLDVEKTSSVPGSGIGLFICKRLIELMNGTITVESEEGKGSCFTVEVPEGRPPNPDENLGQASEDKCFTE